jgi:hypothetical protein
MVNDQIDRFINFFLERLSDIENMQIGYHDHIYKALLCHSLIDTLSKIPHPKMSNMKRYTSFVKEFASWKNGSRISYFHLYKFLSRIKGDVFPKLHDFIYNYKWNKSTPYFPLENDPEFDEVAKLWPKEKGKFISINKVNIYKFQHFFLLYSSRNLVIHELMATSQGHELEEKEPYYYETRDEKGSEWRLYYPPIFLITLARTCVQSLKLYLYSNDINPYSYFDYGSMILRELR